MEPQTNQDSIDVQYGQQPVIYTSQFMIGAGAEEVTLDCVSTVEKRSDGSTFVPGPHTSGDAMGCRRTPERVAHSGTRATRAAETARSSAPYPRWNGQAAIDG